MLNKYRLSMAGTVALAVFSAAFGALSMWQPAWVCGAFALALSQLARHFNSMITVRGVETVLRRTKQQPGAAVTSGPVDNDAVVETHELVKRLAKQANDRAQLEAQTLRQVAAEVRLLRLRDEGAAQ